MNNASQSTNPNYLSAIYLPTTITPATHPPVPALRVLGHQRSNPHLAIRHGGAKIGLILGKRQGVAPDLLVCKYRDSADGSSRFLTHTYNQHRALATHPRYVGEEDRGRREADDEGDAAPEPRLIGLVLHVGPLEEHGLARLQR